MKMAITRYEDNEDLVFKPKFRAFYKVCYKPLSTRIKNFQHYVLDNPMISEERSLLGNLIDSQLLKKDELIIRKNERLMEKYLLKKELSEAL